MAGRENKIQRSRKEKEKKKKKPPFGKREEILSTFAILWGVWGVVGEAARGLGVGGFVFWWFFFLNLSYPTKFVILTFILFFFGVFFLFLFF